MTDPDDVTLVLAGASISGWTEYRVTRGIERCPNDFDVTLTDLFPGDAAKIVVQPGDACAIKLGADLVITGFVDVVETEIDDGGHSIHVTGRGACQDIVDCSAERPTGQFKGMTALQIAQELIAVYGLKATGPSGPMIPQFNLMMTESPWDIIERICRFAGLLAYEGPDGNLVLAVVDSAKAASGATEGENVQKAKTRFSMNERFSEYDVFLQDMDVWNDLGQGGNQVATARDPNVKRHRSKHLIAEGGAGGLQLAQPRANWEAARRLGRSTEAWVTVDGCRDSAGALWSPNTEIPLALPSVKLPKASWVLSEVTYARDSKGTRADLVCLPSVALTPQPILLQPVDPDLLPGAVPPPTKG